MKATICQLLGLIGLTTAATIELGASGLLGGASVGLVYVGLAMER